GIRGLNRQTTGVLQECPEGPVPDRERQQLVAAELGRNVSQRKVQYERLIVLREVLVVLTIENIVGQSIAVRAGVGVAFGADSKGLLFCKSAHESEAVGKAFGHFNLESVVPGVSERSPVIQDGSELRKWP